MHSEANLALTINFIQLLGFGTRAAATRHRRKPPNLSGGDVTTCLNCLLRRGVFSAGDSDESVERAPELSRLTHGFDSPVSSNLVSNDEPCVHIIEDLDGARCKPMGSAMCELGRPHQSMHATPVINNVHKAVCPL